MLICLFFFLLSVVFYYFFCYTTFMGTTIHGRRLVLQSEGLWLSVNIEILCVFYCIGNLYERGMIAMMTIEGLIAVVSLVLTAFGLGYTIGNKSQK